MARSKKQKKEPQAPTAVAAHATTATPGAGADRAMGLGTLAAGIGIAICIALSWVSRWALNVDGVAYLDLARTAREGDWTSFIQGYWSPLYPSIIGALSLATGDTPTSLMAVSHYLNGAVAIGVITLLWWWGRRSDSPYFTPAIICVFLLASTGLPRIEAVTPDVLLLAGLCWIAYELLHHQDRRAIPMGAALGLSFLAKTSVWPWLLLSIPLRLWSADGPGGRRAVGVSSAIALLIAALWVTPLSLKSGTVTLGSAGKLNYAWYIEGSNARTPDTHEGHHREARTIQIDGAHQVELFTFARGDRWTYAPWSDPTAWADGVLTSNATVPRIPDLLAYWGSQAGRTFGFWILPVLLGVVLPFTVAFWTPGLRGRLLNELPARRTAALLGLGGILQFVAVHAEPRLLAPFVFLLSAALLDAILAGQGQVASMVTRGRVATAVAWGMVLWLGSTRLSTGVTEAPRNAAAIERIIGEQGMAAFNNPRANEVLLAGPAMPYAAAAFMAGIRIVAQIPPASLVVAQSLTTGQQDSVLLLAAGGRAGTIWITDPIGGVQIQPIQEPR
jgi:hypothetical protein